MESADSWLSPRNFQIRQARKMDEFSRCVSLRATIATLIVCYAWWLNNICLSIFSNFRENFFLLFQFFL
eukprot:NP_491054.2 Uncharacterized protein CELE_W10C8.3 [Caenorhabditis elegans]